MVKLWKSGFPVIGCVHLRPLPGSPGYGNDLQRVYDHAMEEAKVLEKAGVDGLIIENFGDAPFYGHQIPPVTVACMAAIASKICREVQLPVGINALRNDAEAALSIALASGAQFIRVNIHMHAMMTDQGIIEGRSFDTLRLRSGLQADHIGIFADIKVKHAQSLVPPDLQQWTDDLITRGKVDAIIVSGSGTGMEADLTELETVKKYATVPVLMGSGITPDNIGDYRPFSDGAIIGTYFKKKGRVTDSIDPERVQKLLAMV